VRPRFITSFLVPKALRAGGVARSTVQIVSHILNDYGWLRSMKHGRSVDAQGEPIPWFTYPANDFIKQLDLSDLSVFEYGSGYSTLFWAKRCKNIVSIEFDKGWFQELSSLAPSNAELIFSPRDVETYVNQIAHRGMFDVIVIDGTGESRLPCCRIAPNHLAKRGLIILDNSDLWPESAAALRGAGLIQADFTGLAPLSSHWHTTSVFFSRQYDIQPLNGRQPHKSAAQPAQPWPGV
jgi:hypothetical protein